jgi:hypothetical protein
MPAGKLSDAWRIYAGAAGAKLTDRAARAIGDGSTRAELQNWHMDLDRKTAKCERSRSYRQGCRAQKESG